MTRESKLERLKKLGLDSGTRGQLEDLLRAFENMQVVVVEMAKEKAKSFKTLESNIKQAMDAAQTMDMNKVVRDELETLRRERHEQKKTHNKNLKKIKKDVKVLAKEFTNGAKENKKKDK